MNNKRRWMKNDRSITHWVTIGYGWEWVREGEGVRGVGDIKCVCNLFSV
jgi:hypothetical protein